MFLNPNLGGGQGVNLPPPSWFSLNNSETVKALTLAFRSIQYHFIGNVRTKFGFPCSPQSPDMSIFNFHISGQSLIKRNCHNSRTSDDIDTTLEPVTTLDNRNRKGSKKFNVDVMLENYNVIAIFSIYSQFGVTRKTDSGDIVCKTHIFINSNFLGLYVRAKSQGSSIILTSFGHGD